MIDTEISTESKRFTDQSHSTVRYREINVWTQARIGWSSRSSWPTWTPERQNKRDRTGIVFCGS